MPLTTLDQSVALILIDLQKGIVSQPTAHAVSGVLQNARTLADAFRSHRLPVVLVNVEGGAPGRVEQARKPGVRPADWAQLVPELNQQPDDLTVTKHTWGAFTNTGLESLLRKHGVTHVVVGGVSTSIGVETSARQAYEHGFNVSLAVDAMTDTNIDAHTNSVTRVFPRLGETGSTAELVTLLSQREKH